MSVADKIEDYCRRSIDAEPRWHYKQFRPMTLGISPDVEQWADCSSHATQSYYFADAPDPNHENFSGYGYTGTLVNNPRTSAPYEIGDLGIYGTSTSNTTHVVTCYKPGGSSAALWCSHGSEGGPYPVSLYYRSDLLCVVRPGLGDGGGGDVPDIPDWYYPWARWYLTSKREPDERPKNAPEKIPQWAWDMSKEDDKIATRRGMTGGEQEWIVWYLGGKQGERPDVPDDIPDFWWDDAEYVQQQRRMGD